MPTRLEFYFDYLSPYAYLAWLRLPSIMASREVELEPKPTLFAGLLNHWGQLGPAEIKPKKQHVFSDCARFAKLHELPFAAPQFHPFRPLLALRVSLAAVQAGCAEPVIDAIFKAGWAKGFDLASETVIGEALRHAGVDGQALLASAQSPEIKHSLRDHTAAATALGVFGVPTIRVKDRSFWGLDQLPYVALFLDDKDPLDAIDVDTISPQGEAASRLG